MNDHTNPQNWKIKETKIGTTDQKLQKNRPVESQSPNLYNPSFSKHEQPASK